MPSFSDAGPRAASKLTAGSSVLVSPRRGKKLPILAVPCRFRRSLALAAALIALAPCEPALGQTGSQDKILEWSLPGLPEPSGVVYHAGRKTLFVVSDEGGIGEVTVDGKVLSTRAFGGDLEGITYDPASGYLYVVREGHEILFEVDPATFAIRRRFTIDRAFGGDPDFLERGGDGIEGIAFVPVTGHPEGGRFFAVNQYDPPALVELAVPLRSSKERFERAKVVSAVRIPSPPLSDLVWCERLSAFLIPSALWRSVLIIDASGQRKESVRIPGIMQEGIALLPDGAIVIAQDTGGLIKWYPASNPFEGRGTAGANETEIRVGETQ